jgi:hypothetical protein
MTGPSLFTSSFATYPDVWPNQPAALRVDCGLTVCDAATVRDLAALNPGRVLWFDGDVSLDSGGAIGSPTDPVAIAATGDIDIGVDVYGVVYAASDTWTTGGAGNVFGATLAAGDVVGAGTFATVYDGDVLTRLRWTSGSFVRVPGGWYDWDRTP